MLRKLFKRKKPNNTSSNIDEDLTDPRTLAFKILILTYLERNNIDPDGNQSLTHKELDEEDDEWLKIHLNASGFDENIEHVIIDEWNKNKINDSIQPKDFTRKFMSEFHNLKIEKFAPDFVKERNKKLLDAYKNIIKSIGSQQKWLEDEHLRTIIESDYRSKSGVKSTMYQCTTPFSIISLGCDTMGRYSIVYSVDYRIQEMISDELASMIIRKINELTPGEMGSFVKIGSLCSDCIEVFNQIISESQNNDYHTITTQSEYNTD